MWPYPQLYADLVTFTEKILNGKLYFLCSVIYLVWYIFTFFLDTFLRKWPYLRNKSLMENLIFCVMYLVWYIYIFFLEPHLSHTKQTTDILFTLSKHFYADFAFQYK